MNTAPLPDRQRLPTVERIKRSRWLAWTLVSLAACSWATVLFQFLGDLRESAPLVWWVSRGTGLIAYAAMTASVLLGLMVSWRGLAGALDQRRIFNLHDLISYVTLIATAVHIAAVGVIVVFGPTEFMVVAPVPATLGIVAAVGIALVYASRWLTKRLPGRRWRLLHRVAFLVFLASVGHAMLAAPGLVESPIRWLYALLGGVAGGAVLFRVMFRHLGGAPVTVPVSLSADPAIAAGRGWSHDSFIAEVDRLLSEAAVTGEQMLLVYVDCSAAAGLETDPVDWAERASGAVVAAVKRRDLVTRLGDDGLVVIRRARGVLSQRAALREAVHDAVLLSAADGDDPLVGVACYPVDAWRGEGLLRAAIMSMYEQQLAFLQTPLKAG